MVPEQVWLHMIFVSDRRYSWRCGRGKHLMMNVVVNSPPVTTRRKWIITSHCISPHGRSWGWGCGLNNFGVRAHSQQQIVPRAVDARIWQWPMEWHWTVLPKKPSVNVPLLVKNGYFLSYHQSVEQSDFRERFNAPHSPRQVIICAV